MVGIPALILEHSFHTNAYMTEWLLDEEKLDRMARAEATAIGEYFGMKKMLKGAGTSETKIGKGAIMVT